MRFVVLAVALGIAFAGPVSADENVRAGRSEENVRTVQEKLRADGFYTGEINGAYSSDLALALTRYQIRNGLPVTGQLAAEWRRVKVTFPLRYELRNGTRHSSGKISKTVVLEPAGDDFQITAVNERKSN